MARLPLRFQTVLRLRESLRQQRRLELAQAFEAERLLRQQIEAIAAEVATVRQQSRVAAAPGEVNVDELLDLRRYALRLQAESQVLQQRQVQVQAEIERRRLALVEADREVRIWEKLREKQELVFRSEQQRAEQKLLDEAGARQAESQRRNRA